MPETTIRPWQFVLNRNVEAMVVCLRQILRIPNQRRSAHAELRSRVATQDWIERVDIRRVWIGESLLGNALQRRQGALVARHAIERRL